MNWSAGLPGLMSNFYLKSRAKRRETSTVNLGMVKGCGVFSKPLCWKLVSVHACLICCFRSSPFLWWSLCNPAAMIQESVCFRVVLFLFFILCHKPYFLSNILLYCFNVLYAIPAFYWTMRYWMLYRCNPFCF